MRYGTYKLRNHWLRVSALGLIVWCQGAPAQESLWERHTDLGNKLREPGDYVAAERAYLSALEAAENMGTHNSLLARSLNNLAALYYAQGHYTDAGALYQRALALWERGEG